MFERFTDRARRIMALANREALRLNHDFIGTEHILLGLIAEGTGVGANVLKKLGVNLTRAREEVEKLLGAGDQGPRGAKLPQTPRAKQVIAFAIEEARKLNHHYVGSEHLLLGLLRESDGVAAQVLMQLGVKLEAARNEVMTLLGQGTSTDSSPAPRRSPRRFRVGIVGVSGYGGGEALRLCAGHPHFQVVYVAGDSSAGSLLGERFPGIGGLADLRIEKWDLTALPELDVLFASLPTGQSKDALSRVAATTRIIDIGGDHRFADGWTYGLADVWPEKIKDTSRVANPGCFPAASLAALAPLVANQLIEPGSAGGIIIDAKTGVSGAGRGGGATFGYAEVNEDVAAYGLLKHPHVPEMIAALAELSASAPVPLTFTPHLIPMTRGILATCYARGTATTQQCLNAARNFYAGRPFVRVVDKPPHTKWASGTNLAFVSYAADPERNLIIALGAIDNLGKGAAGQAVQNANLMLGLSETAGLEGTTVWP